MNIIEFIDLLLGLAFVASMIVIGVIDIKTGFIPPVFHPLFLIMGMMRITISGDVKQTLFSSILATFFALPMALVNIRWKAFGGGDVKLVASAGFFLGITSLWQGIITSFLMAGLFATVFSIAMVFREKKIHKIPLGPFLALGLIYGYVAAGA